MISNRTIIYFFFTQFQSLSQPIHSLVRDLQLYRTARPFDRRCTALEWHPRRQGYLAVASKGGDIILWNTNTMGHEQFIEGVRILSLGWCFLKLDGLCLLISRLLISLISLIPLISFTLQEFWELGLKPLQPWNRDCFDVRLIRVPFLKILMIIFSWIKFFKFHYFCSDRFIILS